MITNITLSETQSSSSCDVNNFQMFQELYGSYVQMNDRFETVHIWSEELALKNKGRWVPILINKSKYETENLL